MNCITVKNLSTLTDSAALVRVAMYMNGNKKTAVTNLNGARTIDIEQKNMLFTVRDVEV